MNSYLTAVVLLIAAAIQADAFTGSMPLTGARSSASQRTVFKMELSPYEEYMKSRGQSVAPAAPAAPAASAPVSAPSAPAPVRSSSATRGGKWQPRDKPSWKSSPSSPRGGGVSRPAVSAPKVSSPSAPAAYTPPAPPSPAPAAPKASAATGAGHVGSGGMADTRDPEPVNHEDPRKSISAAPSFEEYLKSRG